jgi:hypothetical protein
MEGHWSLVQWKVTDNRACGKNAIFMVDNPNLVIRNATPWRWHWKLLNDFFDKFDFAVCVGVNFKNCC